MLAGAEDRGHNTGFLAGRIFLRKRSPFESGGILPDGSPAKRAAWTGPAVLAACGAVGLGLGIGLYLVVMAEVDLRFVACDGNFRLDAQDAYCRSPGYLLIAASHALRAASSR